MSDAPDDLISPARVRTMQIIHAALTAGVVIFLVVVVFLVQNNGGPLGAGGTQPLLSVMALGLLAAGAVASVLLPNSLLRQNVRGLARGSRSEASAAGSLLALRQVSMIVGLALLEGPAFFCCVAYLLEARVYVLGAAVLAVLFMLSRFPTEGRVRAWLREQLDRLAAERERLGPPDAP